MQIGVLVGTLKFQKIENIDAGYGMGCFLGGADDDTGGVDLIDDAGPLGDDGGA